MRIEADNIKDGNLEANLPPKQTPRRTSKVLLSLVVLLSFLFFFSTACGPRRQVVVKKKGYPTERREEPREVPRESPKEEKPPVDRVEKRETKGVQYGVASWYGNDFHGKPTASGEIYDMYQLTCAHNTLPLGTMVIVTNLDNGRSLEVKVNDRGPFAKGRIIDLSYAAAKMLGFWEQGTTTVKVETLGSWIEEVPRFTVQVGSFSDEQNAQRLAEILKRDFDHVHLTIVETSIQKYYRVRVGQFETRESALVTAERLSQMGYRVLVTSR
jgi:rare lipoprotein A